MKESKASRREKRLMCTIFFFKEPKARERRLYTASTLIDITVAIS
jgi:hypothetical protein